MNVVIAEMMAPAGTKLLQSQKGWNVVVSTPKEYTKHLAEADALIVRSAVQVNEAVLKQAPKLRAIGRAGVGVDNVDLAAATAAGVLVMNTPGGNAVSVAEHTIALMLSMARFIPQASASTKAGKWEKKKFLGSELRGKMIGVIGLGSIGREVVKRARAFEMRVRAHDPYVTAQFAKDLGIQLVSLGELYQNSDYITVHVSLTPETDKLLNEAAFAQMKTGVRIVNCARGELVDETALKAAIESGKVAGAALDVYLKEPTDSSNPLFAFDQVLATPHIGGSTEEAQEIVGVRIAEQIVEYLNNGVAINAVNMPAMSPEQYKGIGPFVGLAERLGNVAAHLATGNPKAVRLTYSGRIAEMNTTLLRNAGLAGALNRSTATKRANVINAMQLASDRGWNVAEVHDRRSGHSDTIRLEVVTESGSVTVEGAVILDRPRLMHVDNIYCEVQLTGPLVLVRNLDVPGVVAHIGKVFAAQNINIANFSLGRRDSDGPHEAMAAVMTDGQVPQSVLDSLMSNPAIKLARFVPEI